MLMAIFRLEYDTYWLAIYSICELWGCGWGGGFRRDLVLCNCTLIVYISGYL
jgi:hypothetical protein